MSIVDQNITPITSRLEYRRGRQNDSGTNKSMSPPASASGKESQQDEARPRDDFADGKLPYENSQGDALVKAGQEIERFLQLSIPNTRLKIDMDEESNCLVYQVVDSNTGEVIRKFQPADLLRYLKSFREIEGLVVDGRS